MEKVKLNELCDINIGKTPSRSKKQFWGQGYNWLAISDLKEKFITDTKEEITELAIKDCNMKLVPKNTVVMSFKLSIGKTAILKKDMYTNEAIANFQIKDNNKIIPEYLYYAIKTLDFTNTDRAVMGATLNKSKLNEIVIPYCDLNKQIKIVDTLDKAQHLIDLKMEQLELLDELVKSRFIEMFGDPITNPRGWKKSKLNNVCLKITDGEHKNPEFIVKGIPMVMANNIRGNVDLNNCKYISKEDYIKFSKKCNPEKGDILLVSRGATIGRCCENNKEENFALMGSVILIKNNKEIINSKFILNWFKHEGIKKIIYKTSSASAQQAIYMKDLREKKVIIPPIELQNQFADFVTQVDKLKFEMEKSLKELEDNFNSLMQKAFKGELF